MSANGIIGLVALAEAGVLAYLLWTYLARRRAWRRRRSRFLAWLHGLRFDRSPMIDAANDLFADVAQASEWMSEIAQGHEMNERSRSTR